MPTKTIAWEVLPYYKPPEQIWNKSDTNCGLSMSQNFMPKTRVSASVATCMNVSTAQKSVKEKL